MASAQQTEPRDYKRDIVNTAITVGLLVPVPSTNQYTYSSHVDVASDSQMVSATRDDWCRVQLTTPDKVQKLWQDTMYYFCKVMIRFLLFYIQYQLPQAAAPGSQPGGTRPPR